VARDGAGSDTITGDGGLMILLLALAAAGIAYRALPRWLGWSALPLGLVQLTPIGFFAGLLFLVWTAVAGVYLTVRPAAPPARSAPRSALAGSAS